MQLTIRHEVRCRLRAPARNLVFLLRLNPRSHEGQHVTDWRLETDMDGTLKAGRDELGNAVHRFSVRGPLHEVRIIAAGVVHTLDTAGIVRGTVETLPVEVFLRDTPLTVPDPDLRRFAESAAGSEPRALGRLHALMAAVHAALPFEPRAGGALGTEDTPASEILARKSGDASGHAHVFIACARHLGIPSRFVAGHLRRGAAAEAACHAWAEAHVERLGWVGFDPTANACPKGEHVRCAVGFDGLGAAALRGSHANTTTHRVEIAASE